jgi:hypothetical protein
LSSNGAHTWYIAPSGTAGNTITYTQAMTLDASGNLGVGVTSINAKIEALGRIRSNSSSGNFECVNGFQIATFDLYDANTAEINSYSGTTPKAIRFAGYATEYGRFDSSGNLLVGTTSTSVTSGGVAIWKDYSSAGSSAIDIGHVTGAASGDRYAIFTYNGSVIGSITQSGTTAVLYNVTSDQRLKENITNAESASDLIDAIQVRQYNWKSDGSHTRYGFVAQELVTIAPEAVSQPTDSEEMMAVDYSKLVPMLVKEIQSLRKRLATLESK